MKSRFRNRAGIRGDFSTTDRIYLVHHDSVLDLLEHAVWNQLNETDSSDKNHSPAENAWRRFAFMAIRSGIAGGNFMEEIFSLRYADVALRNEYGCVLISRDGGRFPIPLSSESQLFALSLCAHLSRQYGAGRNRVGAYPDDGYILPGRSDPQSPPTDEELKKWHTSLSQWLSNLGSSVGIRISLPQLAALSRGRTLREFPTPLAALLLGAHFMNPIPIGQVADIDQYLSPLPLKKIMRGKTPQVVKEHRPRLGWMAHETEMMKQAKNAPRSSENINALRSIIRPLFYVERDAIADVRKKTVTKLRDFHQNLGQSISASLSSRWKRRLKTFRLGDLTWLDVDAINTLAMAEWSIQLAKTKSPKTLEAYLNDLIIFMRANPAQLIFYADEESIARTLEVLNLAPHSQARWLASLMGFMKFITMRWGIAPEKIRWWRFYRRESIAERSVLTQDAFEKVLGDFHRQGTKSRPVLVALLLGYYFGLRVSEIAALQIGDLNVAGTPTVFVWRTKRGKSRFVEVADLPDDVLSFLRSFHAKRLSASADDYSARLIVDSDGRRLAARRLIELLSKSLKSAGVSAGIGKEKDSVSHLLRHACANRWWALGMPLLDIARRLGHSSPDTTLNTYLHIFSYFLWKRYMSDTISQDRVLTLRQISALAGITPRRCRQLLKGRLTLGVDDALQFLKSILFEKQKSNC